MQLNYSMQAGKLRFRANFCSANLASAKEGALPLVRKKITNAAVHTAMRNNTFTFNHCCCRSLTFVHFRTIMAHLSKQVIGLGFTSEFLGMTRSGGFHCIHQIGCLGQQLGLFGTI